MSRHCLHCLLTHCVRGCVLCWCCPAADALEYQYPPHMRQGSFAEEGRSVNMLKVSVYLLQRQATATTIRMLSAQVHARECAGRVVGGQASTHRWSAATVRLRPAGDVCWPWRPRPPPATALHRPATPSNSRNHTLYGRLPQCKRSHKCSWLDVRIKISANRN